jgi:hypothetical protein
MLRPEFVQRKLQLIAEDLGRLLGYKVRAGNRLPPIS